MNIQEKIVKDFPLTRRIPCGLNCYFIEKKRFLVFWEDLITRESINKVLNTVQEETSTSSFPSWKTLIVVGKTNEQFKKEELFYFDNICTFVVFFLLNEDTNSVYLNDSWLFALGYNYRKSVRKIYRIITAKN